MVRFLQQYYSCIAGISYLLQDRWLRFRGSVDVKLENCSNVSCDNGLSALRRARVQRRGTMVRARWGVACWDDIFKCSLQFNQLEALVRNRSRHVKAASLTPMAHHSCFVIDMATQWFENNEKAWQKFILSAVIFYNLWQLWVGAFQTVVSFFRILSHGVDQACITYGSRAACGPQKLFLRPARAFSMVENVAKARLRIRTVFIQV